MNKFTKPIQVTPVKINSLDEFSLPLEAVQIIIDNLPSMIGYWDIDLKNKFVNKAYEDWFGVDAKKLTGKHISEVIGQALYQLNSPYIEAVLKGEPQEFERCIPNKNGKGFRYSLANYIPHIRDGKIHGFIALVTDITSLKQVESELKISEERYRAVVQGQTEVISRLKADGVYIFVNEAYCRFFGKTPDEIIGNNWHPVVYPDDISRVTDELATMSQTNPIVMIENRVFSGEGIIHWMQFCNKGFFNAEGELVEIQSVGRDITNRKFTEQQIEKLAFNDLLTGLYNRNFLLDQFNLAILRSSKNDTSGACLFLDLDNFKPVNDHYGHDYGDMILTEVATRLKRNLRDTDLVGRYGGDEFVIVIENLSNIVDSAKEEVFRMAEKIRNVLSKPYKIKNQKIEISACIGIAMFIGSSKSSEELLKEADAAMYKAKLFKKNSICISE